MARAVSGFLRQACSSRSTATMPMNSWSMRRPRQSEPAAGKAIPTGSARWSAVSASTPEPASPTGSARVGGHLRRLIPRRVPRWRSSTQPRRDMSWATARIQKSAPTGRSPWPKVAATAATERRHCQQADGVNARGIVSGVGPSNRRTPMRTRFLVSADVSGCVWIPGKADESNILIGSRRHDVGRRWPRTWLPQVDGHRGRSPR